MNGKKYNSYKNAIVILAILGSNKNSMKNILLALTLQILLVNFSTAQQQGAYTSSEEYLGNKPQYPNIQFDIKKRSKTDIVMMGGNDYKVKSTSNEISNGTLKKEIWGIYQSDTLYLNSKPVTRIVGFSVVNELGRYDFVKFPFPANKSVQKELGVDFQSLHNFGAVGGAISGGQLATMRLNFAFDSKTGNLILLSKENLQDLNSQYGLQKDVEELAISEDDEDFVKFLKELNEAESENP